MKAQGLTSWKDNEDMQEGNVRTEWKKDEKIYNDVFMKMPDEIYFLF